MRGIGRTSAKQLQAELGGARGESGRLLCTWCKVEVPKGRRTWCSDECVAAYRAINDWNTIRKAVQKRDKGICAICYTDTKVLKRQFQQVKKLSGRTKALEFAARFGMSAKRVKGHWWDADHIVPCAEGGEDKLDNLRTLCVLCHKMETQLLMQNLTLKRRVAAASESPAS